MAGLLFDRPALQSSEATPVNSSWPRRQGARQQAKDPILEAERAAAAAERAATQAESVLIEAAEAAMRDAQAQAALAEAQRIAALASERAKLSAAAVAATCSAQATASFAGNEAAVIAFGEVSAAEATPTRSNHKQQHSTSPQGQFTSIPLGKLSRQELERRDAPSWDIHIALHCVRPTGKSQPPLQQLEAAVTAAHRKHEKLSKGFKRQTASLAIAQAQVSRLLEETARLDEQRAEAAAVLQALKRLQAAQANGASTAEDGQPSRRPQQKPRSSFSVAAAAAGAAIAAGATPNAAAAAGRAAAAAAPQLERLTRPYPHTRRTVRAAWLGVLEPLKARLNSLSTLGVVECAVLGFAKSDARLWQTFWTPSASQADTASLVSAARPVTCIGPDAGDSCPCAYCSSRRFEVKRSGARRSMGEGGAYAEGAEEDDEDEGEDEDDDEEEGKEEDDEEGAGGGGGGGEQATLRLADRTTSAAAGRQAVGTRVSGVVRIRAADAVSAMDLLCEQLASALRDARGPASVEEARRTEEHCLYDVTWLRSAAGKERTRSYAYKQPVLDALASMADTGSKSGSKVHTSTSGGALYGSVRPFACNKHSALLVDLQARLLRTDGSSFAYLSGRSQRQHSASDVASTCGSCTASAGARSLSGVFDEEKASALPWIQIGRTPDALASDRQTYPLSSRASSPSPRSQSDKSIPPADIRMAERAWNEERVRLTGPLRTPPEAVRRRRPSSEPRR